MLAKPCVLLGKCPGDLGETEVFFMGVELCNRKDSPVVKLFGALEAAEAYINMASLKAPGRLARVLRLSQWSLRYLGFYLSTGSTNYFEASLDLIKRAAKLLFSIAPMAPLGWVICRDELCSSINLARVWVRWAERRLASLKEGREGILVLNHVGNILFDSMRTREHYVVRGRSLTVVNATNVEGGQEYSADAFRDFLGTVSTRGAENL